MVGGTVAIGSCFTVFSVFCGSEVSVGGHDSSSLPVNEKPHIRLKQLDSMTPQEAKCQF